MPSVDQTVLVIGSLVADYLSIGPISDVDGFGYGSVAVGGASGSFSAKIKCETSRHDLASLKDWIKAQHSNPALQQNWVSMDDQLRIGFSGTVLGAIRASVIITQFGECDRVLSYDLVLDQSYLPKLIMQLATILASMPEAQS